LVLGLNASPHLTRSLFGCLERLLRSRQPSLGLLTSLGDLRQLLFGALECLL
jgi:hypothetical protein